MIPKRTSIEVNLESLQEINETLHCRTERGFQGQFYYLLQSKLITTGYLKNGLILEMETQRNMKAHQLRIRPDVILHVPMEHANEPPNKNNYATCAFKKTGN